MTDFLLWFLGVPAALAGTLAFLYGLEWAVWQAGTAAARCHDRLDQLARAGGRPGPAATRTRQLPALADGPG